jgi:hypothetical protein
MTKYDVVLSSVGQLSAQIEVEAESQKDAEIKALDFIKYTEWCVEDIEPDETFIVSITNKEDPINYST